MGDRRLMGRDARASDGVGRARNAVDRRGIGEFDTCRVVSGPSGARVMPRGPTHVRLPVPAATHRKQLTRSLVKTAEAVRIRDGAVERVDAYLSGVNLLVRAVGHHLRVMNDPWRLSMTLGTPRNRPRRADDGDPMGAFSRAKKRRGRNAGRFRWATAPAALLRVGATSRAALHVDLRVPPVRSLGHPPPSSLTPRKPLRVQV